ncbi:hypothetical protein BDV96DRAFT_229932 [Lophiotrema nucula]|uniref:Endonuclease/exonuclease/phosphatase n=1 Tax=Lophiotrema nucula TaxID=690887 RepID=A0A6A5YS66_9PLEO|nr:hypothetical protein BDV96DRAFT_229932 [Lophiotrema nucula]
MSDSNETQAAEPTSFKLLHANVHGCEDYQRKTLLTAANSKCYRHHVIMFQEAWRRTKTTKFPGYRLAHSNDIEASDTYVSFAIYVRNDIPIKSYRPARIFCTCSGATRAFHEKNIGTICYDLKDGRELYVTCFYNQKARAELACLISTLRLGGPNALHIFGGDSNLHGRWGGPDIQYDSAGVALYDAFVEEGLQLLNTEGQYTWHGVRGDEGVESFTGIDITFASAELCCPLFPFWDIVRDAELADTRMDHFAIQVIFDGLLDEPKPQRHYALDEVDPKEFGTRVEDRLRGLPRSFQSNAQLDWFAEQFMARMSDVVEEHVPLVESKPRRSKFTVKDTPQMQELKRARNRLSRDWHTRVKIASRAFQASNDRSTRRKEAIFANAKRVKAELRQHEERIQQLHRIEFTKLWRGSFFETEDTVRRLTRFVIITTYMYFLFSSIKSLLFN